VPVRAVVFDFNGTLSNDEPVLCAIFVELFEAHGKPLSAQQYFDELCGLSDPEIVRTWLGPDHRDVEEVIQERIVRYRAAVADGSTVEEWTREALHYAAERVPVAIVSGAARSESEPVFRAAGLDDFVSFVVPAEDVEHGKPHPDGYLRALELFDSDLRAPEVLVFEDTEAGIASAKAAGMTVVALAGTLAPERLREADYQVDRITVEVMQRYLG
jgi:beta-phosphoglucomutase